MTTMTKTMASMCLRDYEDCPSQTSTRGSWFKSLEYHGGEFASLFIYLNRIRSLCKASKTSDSGQPMKSFQHADRGP